MNLTIINRGPQKDPPLTDADKKVGKNMTIFQGLGDFNGHFVPIAVSPIVKVGHKWITLDNGRKFHVEDGEISVQERTDWDRSFILPEQSGDRELVEAYYQGYRELKYKIHDVSKSVIDAFVSANIRASDFEFIKSALDRFYNDLRRYAEEANAKR